MGELSPFKIIHYAHALCLFQLLSTVQQTRIISFRVFELLSSSLCLYSQRFGRCVLWSFSGVSCQTQKPTHNFKQRPLINPPVLLALIPLTITVFKC